MKIGGDPSEAAEVKPAGASKYVLGHAAGEERTSPQGHNHPRLGTWCRYVHALQPSAPRQRPLGHWAHTVDFLSAHDAVAVGAKIRLDAGCPRVKEVAMCPMLTEQWISFDFGLFFIKIII